MITRGQLIRLLDTRRIEEALREAEKRTSGEIRVSVAPFFWGSVKHAAERAFERLGMTATRDRNGILFFVVPSRKRFTILGDAGIHAKVGQAFWEELAALLSKHFHEKDFNGGLTAAILRAGERLAEHFPHAGEKDVNELPDHVDFGPDGP
ncbi:MAG: TPM domain-containing protein [Myxococcaceae bacterium]